jgi:hypothetical protein
VQGLLRPDGSRRPAFHAHQLAVGKIRTSQKVERLSTGDSATGDDVYVYRFQTDNGPVLIAWAEAGEQAYRLETRAPSVVVTPIPVESSLPPGAERREVHGGSISLTLTSTPTIIEPSVGTIRDR